MRRQLAGLFLMVATVPAFGAPAPSRWIEVRSKHFVVLTDSGEKDGRRIETQFERMHAVFHQLFPTPGDDSAPPIIVLALKDKKAMQALEPAAYLAKNQIDLAGLFVRTTDKNYILVRLDAEQEHAYATVYHEYMHYMLRRAEEWLPLWLNEGLAEFYQNTDIEEKAVRMGQPSGEDIAYLAQHSVLPLPTLFAVDHASPYYHDEQKGSVFYAESWALTHYLIVNDRKNGTHLLRTYTEYLEHHEDPVAAAEHAFGDLKKLQQALEMYIQQRSFTYFSVAQSFPVNESAFEVRPVSQSEADAVRADVLIDTQRPADALALLDAVLRDDPKNALAHEAMGSLKFHDGDIAAAKKWYGEAVQLGSQSYLAHYYYAVMSLQANAQGQDESIESSLRTAIKLGPDFAPSYDALAMFYGRRHEKLDEAHILTLQSVQLEPGNLIYRLNAAEILAQDGKFDNAINVLKAATHLAKTPYETDSIQSRIQRMERVRDAQAQAKQTAGDASVQTASVGGPEVVSLGAAAPADGPKYPPGDANGPRHEIKGVIRGVKCTYPAVITLKVEQPGKAVTLYNNDLFKIVFSAANFTPEKDVNACKEIEGMKARVSYAEASGAAVDGQVLSIELTK